MQALLKSVIVRLLQWEARGVLETYTPQVVAVTGNVGKTSTKDAIYTVLSPHRHVRKSQKSFNSELGVPLTILGCDNAHRSVTGWFSNLFEGGILLATHHQYPEWLVLEVGADAPGDVSSIAAWLKPRIAVITRLPDVPVHVEFFDSPEAVAREKWTLAESVRDDGALILNADDARLQARAKYARHTTYSYGFAEQADVRAHEDGIFYDDEDKPAGVQYHVTCGDQTHEVQVRGILGRQHIYPQLAALAVGWAEGFDRSSLVGALANYDPAPGRMRIIPARNGAVCIDDTYNASPASIYEALETLKTMHVPGRRIVVLGDMLELGQYSASAHRHVGRHVAEVADAFISVGVRMRHARQQAREAGMADDAVRESTDAGNAGKALADVLEPGDVVLVKGSQAMRMEKVVAACMAEPERRKELLARQEPEWQQ